MNDGVVDIGGGCFCYLQDCNQGTGWGWSNSGLIVDSGEAAMIDTLRDEKLTTNMLSAYRDATGLHAHDIATLVNTHRDGDHTYGNRLMSHARIMATRECARQMAERPPSKIMELLNNRPQGMIGDFIFDLYGPPFDFKGIEPTLPNDFVDGGATFFVGGKKIEIIKVGPAHTEGDVLVYSPKDRTVYTGDIVFYTNTPVLWSGPCSNWIAALDHILDMDVEVVVPGHGPLTDKLGVRKTKEYLVYVEQESRARFDAGLSLKEAVEDISLREFEEWGGAERIVVNVNHFYCQFRGEQPSHNLHALIELMAPYANRARKRRQGLAAPPDGARCCAH